ncbi:hypothetical protein KCP75_05820 [Salmonella enterica subsp. enterica]|nr:hypothetical protein KCP75_05820 [Salmonella enterica subsp. enterica]
MKTRFRLAAGLSRFSLSTPCDGNRSHYTVCTTPRQAGDRLIVRVLNGCQLRRFYLFRMTTTVADLKLATCSTFRDRFVAGITIKPSPARFARESPMEEE